MNRFTFLQMNHRVDRVLNSLLTKALDSGIKTVTSTGSYYFKVTFNDGSILTAWNSNRYYAWLSSGYFTYPKEHDKVYKWSDARPYKSTMARLYKMLGSMSYST